MKIWRKLSVVFGICTALALGSTTPVGAVSSTSFDTHWSGLVDRAGSYTAVTGTFKVPRVTAGCGANGFGAIFIGLGGYGRFPFTQVGISFSPTGYGAFTESFDSAGNETLKNIVLPIRTGDVIALGLSFTSNHSVLEFRVTNTTTKLVSSTRTLNAGRYWNGSSSEWVVERPNSNPLAPYGAIGIANAKALRNGVWYPANTAPDTSVTLRGVGGNVLSRLSAAHGTYLATTWVACK